MYFLYAKLSDTDIQNKLMNWNFNGMIHIKFSLNHKNVHGLP